MRHRLRQHLLRLLPTPPDRRQRGPEHRATFGSPLSLERTSGSDGQAAIEATGVSVTWRRWARALCVVAVASVVAPAQAVDGGAGDLADLILNLARYTTWPVSPSRNHLTICVAHGGALPASAFAMERSITIHGLPVSWRSVGTPAQIPGCMVLWLNADVRPAPRDWLAAAAEQPILTLSNFADFTADGGVVGVYRVGQDWRFEINLEALQRSRLNIAAAALRLSQRPKAVGSSGEPR